jgi:3-hydroxyisobutyrate dehydrogenase-like beta-hydroxyacid dehydrogenase
MDTPIAIIGLGHMGWNVAKRLLGRGFTVRVWNRTADKAEGLIGATIGCDISEALRGAGIALSSLSDDDAVEQVILGPDGVLATLDEQTIHVSLSTLSRAMVERLASEHARAGRLFLNAPVLGRPEAAAQGQLWLLAGGRPDLIACCQGVFDALGRTQTMPDASSAALAKIIANLMLAGVIELLGEAAALAEKGGLLESGLMPFLTEKLFNSPVMHSYGERIRTQQWSDAGFTLTLGLKDVQLALSEGTSLRVPLPAAGVANDHILEALAHGNEDNDWSSFTEAERVAAGLGVTRH